MYSWPSQLAPYLLADRMQSWPPLPAGVKPRYWRLPICRAQTSDVYACRGVVFMERGGLAQMLEILDSDPPSDEDNAGMREFLGISATEDPNILEVASLIGAAPLLNGFAELEHSDGTVYFKYAPSVAALLGACCCASESGQIHLHIHLHTLHVPSGPGGCAAYRTTSVQMGHILYTCCTPAASAIRTSETMPARRNLTTGEENLEHPLDPYFRELLRRRRVQLKNATQPDADPGTASIGAWLHGTSSSVSTPPCNWCLAGHCDRGSHILITLSRRSHTHH